MIRRNRRRLLLAVALLTTAAVVVSGAVWWTASASRATYTAVFPKAIGVHPGSKVRVLGVEVGTVDDVQPAGEVVRTELSLDSGVRIPADASAVVVAPSLVSDRYVQLTPAYTGGPELPTGSEFPLERTSTPVEIDDLYRSADDLATALGPNGANERGAVSDVLDTGAANLRGNGKPLNETIRDLGEAAETMQNSQGDLFGTVRNLDEFTAALARSDDQIHEFHGRFADVAGSLADDKEQLGTALETMSGSLDEVNRFVGENRGLLESNVNKLSETTKGLVDQRAAIAEIIDVAPLAASNYINSYDAASGTVAVRLNLNEFTYPPVTMVCLLIERATPKEIPPALTDICKDLGPAIDDGLGVPPPHDIIKSNAQPAQPDESDPSDESGMPLPLLDAVEQQRRDEELGDGPR
ncbi:MCE family protein [Saccharopolyspora sp. HNM0983]|uniref:MCE family protein n=1 Tax=Saccharopolyspora montiporae TaxID=2781240 RepID=A0A929FWQ7_9PSEU|nr:MCE family protein [Saccharopolyspora sp. HNM0983]MBE9373806.1 MCE family protein [Saccharopolyspora sp. HNM0983]